MSLVLPMLDNYQLCHCYLCGLIRTDFIMGTSVVEIKAVSLALRAYNKYRLVIGASEMITGECAFSMFMIEKRADGAI